MQHLTAKLLPFLLLVAAIPLACQTGTTAPASGTDAAPERSVNSTSSAPSTSTNQFGFPADQYTIKRGRVGRTETFSDLLDEHGAHYQTILALAEAADIMLEESIGSLLVVDGDGALQGIVTDSDFGSSEARVPFSTFKATTLLDRWVGQEGVEQIYEEARRRTFLEAAVRLGVRARFLVCDADREEVRRRLEERDGGASDAGWEVYLGMEERWEAPGTATDRVTRTVPSAGAPEASAELGMEALRAAGLARG